MILRENTETQLISIPSPDSRSPRTCSTLSTISSLNPATKTPRCKIQFVVNWTSTQVGGTPSLQSTSHYHYVKNPQIMGPYLRNYSESPPNFHGFVACDYQAIEDPWSPHYKSPCMKHESKTLCLTSATQNVDTKEKHEAIICIQCISYFTHGEILCNHVPIATRCMLTLDSKTKQSAFTINWRPNWRWSYQMICAQMRQLIFMHVTSLPVAISVDLFSRIIKQQSYVFARRV